jgi:hypothetical protein
MGVHPRIVLGRCRSLAAATAGLAYGVGASFTHPFTGAADVVTAVPLVVVLAVTGWSVSRHRRSRSDDPGPPPGDRTRWSRYSFAWLTLILAIVAWELYCFINLPRARHPTLSALIDILDSSRTGKVVAFVVWLALGWFLVGR